MNRFIGLILFSVSTVSYSYCQGFHSNEVGIIKTLISMDTIIDQRRLIVISDKIQKGMMTKEDSIKFVESLKKRKAKLYAISHNQAMTEQLKQDLRESGPLTQKLTENVLKKVIRRIPFFSEWKVVDFSDSADLVYDPDLMSTYHKFSNPVYIQHNQFLIYHVKYVGRFNGFSKLIIYEVGTEGDILIKDAILLNYN